MINLQISSLLEGYRTGRFTVEEVIAQCFSVCADMPEKVWIRRLSKAELSTYINALKSVDSASLPLYGIPFAVKDNIDLVGIPTTAGCAAYSYTPEQSAFVVAQLIAAGAIPLGKTNLDQFATGLVGTRSPFGACPNSFDPNYISGGSSSGSAVAVALGGCSFSLGTDTAGSGRVPAAFNNLIGLKPSKGLLSCSGVVPACKSLDCVSIFALDSMDAATVFSVAEKFDQEDCYARKSIPNSKSYANADWTFGVPQRDQLKFFGNREYQNAFEKTISMLEASGGIKREIDFSSFVDAAELLYSGPWVNERYAAVGEFIESYTGEAVLKTTSDIILSGKDIPAWEVFYAMYRLQELKRKTDKIMSEVDFLITPTTGTCYKISAVNADPVKLNTNLGYYTNYMNLLDYCAISVPAVMTSVLPFGVTLVAPAGHDKELLIHSGRLHEKSGLNIGTTSIKPLAFPDELDIPENEKVVLAVCGAHLRGYPLHYQLEELNAAFIGSARTAPNYRMFAFSGSDEVSKPGLIYVASGGSSIYVELYELNYASFGRFTATIPTPLGIGKVKLADGCIVSGFIAEAEVAEIGEDITALADWRKYK